MSSSAWLWSCNVRCHESQWAESPAAVLMWFSCSLYWQAAEAHENQKTFKNDVQADASSIVSA